MKPREFFAYPMVPEHGAVSAYTHRELCPVTNPIILREVLPEQESDSIHKAHADILQMENGYLLSRIQKLTDQLKRAESVIEFYADKKNWLDLSLFGHNASITDDEDDFNDLYLGGRRARDYFATRDKGESQ